MFKTQMAFTLLMHFVVNVLFVFFPQKGRQAQRLQPGMGTASKPPSNSAKAQGSEGTFPGPPAGPLTRGCHGKGTRATARAVGTGGCRAARNQTLRQTLSTPRSRDLPSARGFYPRGTQGRCPPAPLCFAPWKRPSWRGCVVSAR